MLSLLRAAMAPRMGLTLSRPLARTAMEFPDTKRARLFYQSKKRGILENDLLLGGFADSHLKQLTAGELDAYEQIVSADHNEWDIYKWITGKVEPPETIDKNMIAKLRDYALSSGAAYHYRKEPAN